MRTMATSLLAVSSWNLRANNNNNNHNNNNNTKKKRRKKKTYHTNTNDNNNNSNNNNNNKNHYHYCYYDNDNNDTNTSTNTNTNTNTTPHSQLHMRPISLLRLWVSEGLPQAYNHNINIKGWKSHVHRGFPGKFESTNLRLETLSTETGRITGDPAVPVVVKN